MSSSRPRTETYLFANWSVQCRPGAALHQETDRFPNLDHDQGHCPFSTWQRARNRRLGATCALQQRSLCPRVWNSSHRWNDWSQGPCPTTTTIAIRRTQQNSSPSSGNQFSMHKSFYSYIGDAESRCLGHERKTVPHWYRGQRLGHRLFRSSKTVPGSVAEKFHSTTPKNIRRCRHAHSFWPRFLPICSRYLIVLWIRFYPIFKGPTKSSLCSSIWCRRFQIFNLSSLFYLGRLQSMPKSSESVIHASVRSTTQHTLDTKIHFQALPLNVSRSRTSTKHRPRHCPTCASKSTSNLAVSTTFWCQQCAQKSSPSPLFSSVPTLLTHRQAVIPFKILLLLAEPILDKRKPSIAAVVASMDAHPSRYCAAVRVQRHRQEVIDDLATMVRDLMVEFYKATHYKPVRIIVYR